MRLALAALLTLLLAAPARAVTVGDEFFDPRVTQVEPEQQVSWSWTGSGPHNVVAKRGQTDRFRSALMTSGSFVHVFRYPGRFSYLCEVHGGMTGEVRVGAPEEIRPRVRRLRPRVSGRTVRVRFRLSERSLVTLKLRGPRRKTVRKVLRAGRRSLRVRRLGVGRYRATLQARDGWRNKSKRVERGFRVSG